MHLESWRAAGNCQIVGICDTDLSRARLLARDSHTNCQVFDDYARMVDTVRPDVLDVCTPPFSHYDILRYAISSKLASMVEKPLCTTAAQADELLDISESVNVPIFPVHNYSVVPSLIRAKALISKGEIGEVVSISVSHLVPMIDRYLSAGHWAVQYPLGVIEDILPHIIMYVLDLSPQRVQSVEARATASPHAQVKYDGIYGTMRLGGITGIFSLFMNCPAGKTYIIVSGSEGSILIDAESQVVSVANKPISSDSILNRGWRSWSSLFSSFGQTSSLTMGVISGRVKPESFGHRLLAKRVLENLGKGRAYPISLVKARDVVWALNQVEKQVLDKNGQ